MAKAQEVKRNWYVVDATNIPLGRLASKIAVILMGKNKPTYTPHVDCGDNVIVINASKVKLTGDAEHKKNYYNVSEYNGGLRTRSSGVMLHEFPVEMIERAVWAEASLRSSSFMPMKSMSRKLRNRSCSTLANKEKNHGKSKQILRHW